MALLFFNRYFIKKIDVNLYRFYTPINYWRNIKRNYDSIALGDSCAFNDLSDVNTANLCLPKQSVYLSFLLLKNYFSVSKSGGSIILYLSPKNIYNSNNSIPALYYKILNPILIKDLSTLKKAIVRFYFIFNPIKTIQIVTKKGFCFEERFRPSQIDQKVIEAIRQMNEFCIQRELKFSIQCIGFSNNEKVIIYMSDFL